MKLTPRQSATWEMIERQVREGIQDHENLGCLTSEDSDDLQLRASCIVLELIRSPVAMVEVTCVDGDWLEFSMEEQKNGSYLLHTRYFVPKRHS